MKLDHRLSGLLGAGWLTVGALSVTGIAATTLLETTPAAVAVTCTNAGTTGLTAAVIATTNETIDPATNPQGAGNVDHQRDRL